MIAFAFAFPFPFVLASAFILEFAFVFAFAFVLAFKTQDSRFIDKIKKYITMSINLQIAKANRGRLNN